MIYGDATNIYLNGNAATATKATQDKNGLQIDTNYLKLSGGTMTGTITNNSTAISKPAISTNVSSS